MKKLVVMLVALLMTVAAMHSLRKEKYIVAHRSQALI